MCLSRLVVAIPILFCAALPARARDLGTMNDAEISVLQRQLTDGGCYSGAIDGRVSADLRATVDACPSQEPILSIEIGMHSAAIKRIGVDRECRLAVTGSVDKTARLWSLPDGRLLQTFRVPNLSAEQHQPGATATLKNEGAIGNNSVTAGDQVPVRMLH